MGMGPGLLQESLEGSFRPMVEKVSTPCLKVCQHWNLLMWEGLNLLIWEGLNILRWEDLNLLIWEGWSSIERCSCKPPWPACCRRRGDLFLFNWSYWLNILIADPLKCFWTLSCSPSKGSDHIYLLSPSALGRLKTLVLPSCLSKNHLNLHY